MAYTTIDDPSAYFNTVLYTGQNPSATTVSVGFKSDFLWLKSRTQTYNHYAFDTTRGGNSQLNPNTTAAESTSGDNVTFNATSFVANTQAINEGGQGADNMVSWNWKANNGTRTTFSESGNNPGGGYQANATAGFSIIDYTGTGATGTVAHGLGITPKVAIIKDRGNAEHWIYATTTVDGSNDALYLETTGAKFDSNSDIDITFTSSNVQLANNWVDVNGDARNYIAYVFAPIQGYSKFGSYTGNGSTNGAFIYTGFKPSWLLIKRTDSIGDWNMVDTTRDTSNTGTNSYLYSQVSDAEQTGSAGFDILSNGFKNRNTHSRANANGGTYIYLAFASSPLVGSDGVPTTAR
jgi:hypothetical protein